MLSNRPDTQHTQFKAPLWVGVVVGFVSILFYVSASSAQNRVDLDDLNIKGELLNDNRLRMSARDPHKMAERVTYRANFRPEIIDGLEIAWPADSSESADVGLMKPTSFDLKSASPGASE